MKNRLLLAFAAILWLAAVTGSYYLTHKPFDLELARNFALAGWRITIAGAILSVAGGLGARLLPHPDGGTLYWRSTQTALGLGLLGTFILFVGLTTGFNGWFFGLLLGGLGIFLRREIRTWWGTWRGLPTLWRGGRLGQLIGLGGAFLLVLTLFTALAPPLRFDALVYHLTLPQTYLAAGRITYQPWLIFGGMPQLTEMLYTWAISLGGVETAPVLGWGIGVLTVIGVGDWASHKISPQAGWGAMASFLGGLTLVTSLAIGYVDWLAMLLGLSTLILLDQWRTNGRQKLLVWAGLCAGFAAGTKYTAGIIALGGLLVVFMQSPRAFSQWVRHGLWFGVPALAGVLPWLLKNFVFTGNPVYPLGFPAGAMNAVRLALYQSPPLMTHWQNVIFLPWHATMLGVEGAGRFGTSIGPLLLGFGLLGWAGRRHHREESKRALSTTILLSLTGLVFWAVSSISASLAIQTRLYLVIFPALAVLAGAGLEALVHLQLPGVRMGRVAGAVLLMVFGFNILEVTAYSLEQGAFQHLLGLSTREEYLAHNLGMTALAYQTVNDLPESSRILMLWETRSLYCLPRCIPDEIVDRWLTDRAKYGSADNILASWRAAGYTHVMIFHTGARFYRDDPGDPNYLPEDWQILDELLGSLSVQTDLNQVYTLYPLTP